MTADKSTPRMMQSVHNVLDEQSFHRTISLERKRAERSHKSFLLMLLALGSPLRSQGDDQALGEILSALSTVSRETDAHGWYKKDATIGVMFTEIRIEERTSIVRTIIARITRTLSSQLTFERFDQFSISFHLFPEDWTQDTHQNPTNPILYPDLLTAENSRKTDRLLKRAVDIAGSLSMLILCAPLFILIASAIKLTSPGPILFRQTRVGRYGIPFVMLKFRSMRVDNDASSHKSYVKELIAGKAKLHPSNDGIDGVYKLTNDSRITHIGVFLRRSSLDELPQLFNVLRGDMSLVGPRPPLPYEVQAYGLWHRRRLLEMKPGVTGLWQVSGRNRVKFDDMVRLDLVYARRWSPWFDMKILLRTPRAVFEGAH